MKSLLTTLLIAFALVQLSPIESVYGGAPDELTVRSSTESTQESFHSTARTELVHDVQTQTPEGTPLSRLTERGAQLERSAAIDSVPVPGVPNKLHDEVWMISTRQVCSSNAPLEDLTFRHREKNGVWRNESLSSFLAEDSDHNPRRVVFYIHGNRATVSKAERRGLQTYERTFLTWHEAPAVRFVIWTWPSDQIPGQLRDLRVKADRADQHSFYLARLLTEMENHREISMIGYSYGGRLAVNALHLLGGGSICGKQIATNSQAVPAINLTLIAPGIRNDCFVSSCSQALKHVNQMFLLYNSEDQLLKLYRYAKFDCQRPALGYTGIAARHLLSEYEDRIKQQNASHHVGQQHDYLEYITDKRIEKMVQENLFSLGATSQRSTSSPGPRSLNSSEVQINDSAVTSTKRTSGL